ncbi:MAG: hypothetical protein JXB62_01955, partial [Pirellulales bacterium]|nr:hypothetical protein [Pirellulales bacterium]
MINKRRYGKCSRREGRSNTKQPLSRRSGSGLRPRTNRPTADRFFRPRLEPLEDRCLLAAMIEVGDHVLDPDTPDQEIGIYITGDEQVTGMNLFVQVGDGGPEVGGTDGPAITGADMITGTIFEEDSVGGANPAAPQIYISYIYLETENSTVTSDGLLVTLTIDTTGFLASDVNNPWDLRMTDTLDLPTQLLDNSPDPQPVPLTIINGTITIADTPNQPPTADADGPYLLDTGEDLPLDGSASFDPD